MHNEIQRRIREVNCAYFAMSKMLSFKMSKTLSLTKEKIYTCIYSLRPVIMYADKTWSTIQGVEKKFLIFERKVL